MYELAGKTAAPKPRRRAPQKVNPHMRGILDRVSDTPAIVMTPIHDVLAWNRLAAALMIDFGEIPDLYLQRAVARSGRVGRRCYDARDPRPHPGARTRSS